MDSQQFLVMSAVDSEVVDSGVGRQGRPPGAVTLRGALREAVQVLGSGGAMPTCFLAPRRGFATAQDSDCWEGLWGKLVSGRTCRTFGMLTTALRSLSLSFGWKDGLSM